MPHKWISTSLGSSLNQWHGYTYVPTSACDTHLYPIHPGQLTECAQRAPRSNSPYARSRRFHFASTVSCRKTTISCSRNAPWVFAEGLACVILTRRISFSQAMVTSPLSRHYDGWKRRVRIGNLPPGCAPICTEIVGLDLVCRVSRHNIAPLHRPRLHPNQQVVTHTLTNICWKAILFRVSQGSSSSW